MVRECKFRAQRKHTTHVLMCISDTIQTNFSVQLVKLCASVLVHFIFLSFRLLYTYLARLCLFHLISSSRWLFDVVNVSFSLAFYVYYARIKLNIVEVK